MPRIKTKKKSGNATITVDINIPIEDIYDSSTVDAIGNRVQAQMVQFMASGISPVNGRKFEKYKDTNKYPKNVMKEYPDKKSSPVTLKLSGKLWNSFNWAKSGALNMLFGINDPDVALYAAVHNRDDTGRPDIPERRLLPTRKGETFNKSIMLEIKRLIVSRLEKLLK